MGPKTKKDNKETQRTSSNFVDFHPHLTSQVNAADARPDTLYFGTL